MAKIEVLRRDIGLHKNMEKQLAKRSHQNQSKIAELKKEAEKLTAERDGIVGNV